MQKKAIIIFLIFFVLGSIFLVIGNIDKLSDSLFSSRKATKLDDRGVSEEDIESLVDANNEFTFKLYEEYSRKYPNENIFYSPYSISIAMSMVYEGASGKTAEEILDVFEFPKDNNKRRAVFANTYNNINKDNKEYKLSTANALWVDNRFAISDSYIETIEGYYGGNVQNQDFRGDVEGARKDINEWVESNTNNKIKDLFSKGTLSEYTRVVLTNAIYFKGDWTKEFDPNNTKESSFYGLDGKEYEVDMMQKAGEQSKFGYYEEESLKALDMSYKGDDLSMLVLLPEKGSMSQLEDNLNMEKLGEIRESLSNERNVEVYFPKFKFKTEYSMVSDLEKLGMPTVFGESADFSGLTEKQTDELKISAVVHQAFIEVNEEGTEAAAATGIAIRDVAIPQDNLVFRADHPFIFLIQQTDTGNILFMGKFVNP